MMAVNPSLSVSQELMLLEAHPPSPLVRVFVLSIGGLIISLGVWAAVGKLDIVAVAEGKLVPATYVKIVQPAEQGIVREILVGEGDHVRGGQVLMRMDTTLAQADRQSLSSDLHTRAIALRRVDAQLNRAPLLRQRDDPPELFAQAQAQYQANRTALENAIAQERNVLDRTRSDLAAAEQVQAKLDAVLPHYQEQERAFKDLGEKGFAGKILVSDKVRERMEKEGDLKSQAFVIQGAQAAIAQSIMRILQLEADYERQLRTERVELASQLERTKQELVKVEHRRTLLELKAPQEGIIKDLATHTIGTVVSPGTILMSLVPQNEPLVAEVWVKNDDVGFVHAGQTAKVKLAAFQFQKYGMLEGSITHVSADAADPSSRDKPQANASASPLVFKTLMKIPASYLEADGRRYNLAPGMQVAAEINLGQRTVIDYLLSPVSKAWHEAGRER
ncbi:MAG: HlyD family type I secretion periplasmic adaptor subunit [Burkholderiales bacterium]